MFRFLKFSFKVFLSYLFIMFSLGIISLGFYVYIMTQR